MAKLGRYRWQNEKRRASEARRRKFHQRRRAQTAPKPWNATGITNRQASYLANLQRRLKTPYTGHGMTKHEAHQAIARALKQLDSSQAPTVQQPESSSPGSTRTEHTEQSVAGGRPNTAI